MQQQRATSNLNDQINGQRKMTARRPSIFRFKSMLILTLIGLLNISSTSFGAGIEFTHGTWTSIVEKAKQENKYIFVDVYAEWCGPCKWMAANVFTDEEVGDTFNQGFISAKIDAEKGEGIGFARQYNVSAYPTFLFFSPEGELVHKIVGGRDTNGLLEAGKDALDPNKQVYTLMRNYAAGSELSPEQLSYLIQSMQAAREDVTPLAKIYLSKFSEEDFKNPENWETLVTYASSTDMTAYQFILDNREYFFGQHGNQSVNNYLLTVLYSDIDKIISSHDSIGLTRIKRIAPKVVALEADAFIAKVEMFYYATDEEKAFESLSNYLDNYSDSPEELNEIAWAYYENANEKPQLTKALEWAKKSVGIKKEYANLNTQAHLEFKLGFVNEAMKTANEAVKIGTKEELDTTQAKDLISILEKGKNNK